MKISVKCLGQKNFPEDWEVSPEWTVSHFKQVISERADCPPQNIKLLLAGKTLHDDATLLECKICEGVKLHAMLKSGSPTVTCDILPVFSRELMSFLKPHYSQPDCLIIIKAVYQDLKLSVNSMALDDIEQLALNRIHNQ